MTAADLGLDEGNEGNSTLSTDGSSPAPSLINDADIASSPLFTTQSPYLEGLVDNDGNMLPQYQGSDLLSPSATSVPLENIPFVSDDAAYGLPDGLNYPTAMQTNPLNPTDAAQPSNVLGYNLSAQLNDSTSTSVDNDPYLNDLLYQSNPYLQDLVDANGNLLPQYQPDDTSSAAIQSGLAAYRASLNPQPTALSVSNPLTGAPDLNLYPSLPTPPTGYGGVVPQNQSAQPVASDNSQSSNLLGYNLSQPTDGTVIPATDSQAIPAHPSWSAQHPWLSGALQVGKELTAPFRAAVPFAASQPMTDEQRSDLVSPLTSLPDQFSAMGDSEGAQAQLDAFQKNYGIDTPEKAIRTLATLGLLTLGANAGAPEAESSFGEVMPNLDGQASPLIPNQGILLPSRSSVPIKMLFRGTTEGFSGGNNTQLIANTPTTTDPLISTIYARQAQTQHGVRGIVFGAATSTFPQESMEALQGTLPKRDSEVFVKGTPDQFAQQAQFKITAEQSAKILQDMGIDIPRANATGDINSALDNAPKLTPSQIDFYTKKALEIYVGKYKVNK
jgi:hypothetical protein